MHVKKDDKVIVISGKDKGTIGKVIKSFPKENRVIVENVNVRKKHLKATNQMEWVGKMNNILNSTLEVINAKLIYS